METKGSQYITQSILQAFAEKAQSLGAQTAQWVKLEKPLSFNIYKQWIEDGQHAKMSYLERHLPIKANPQSKWPKMKSALVLTIPYKLSADQEVPLKKGRIALYSRQQDYHLNIPDEFNSLLSELKLKFPNDEFQLFTDSAPIMERDLAYKAGAGWIGKNACLINRQHGSLFLIAEILSSLEIENNPLSIKDFCGTCSRCIESCPTDAIRENRTLDSAKCISYWTIESKENPPLELAAKFNDWLFGCDICQTVCPWNEKAFGKKLMQNLSVDFMETSPSLVEELKWILTVSEEEFRTAFAGSPLLRSKLRGLRRNALIVIANMNIVDLKPLVDSFRDDQDLRDIANWASGKLL